MKSNKYEICDLVFVKFRGKWDIGRIEFRGQTCGMNWYDVEVKGAKRLQRKYEYELKPTLKWDRV